MSFLRWVFNLFGLPTENGGKGKEDIIEIFENHSDKSNLDIHGPDAEQEIENIINSLEDDLNKLSLEIHDNPELGFKEVFAHRVLTEFLKRHQFHVTSDYPDFPTAWRATYSRGKGGPVIGFNSEMDALPKLGHACGHNLIAVGGVAAAIGLKAAMEKFDGNGEIILLGTPAEEKGHGKVHLLDKGAYAGMDVCMMIHPGPGDLNTAGTSPTLAIQATKVEYIGRSAHAGLNPWDGKNALDAAVMAYMSVSALRQQIMPTCRIHGIIEDGGKIPNAIPHYTRMKWLIRAPSRTEVDNLRVLLENCCKGAAIVTGCELKFEPHDIICDLRQSGTLGNAFEEVVNRRYRMIVSRDPNPVSASTDFGNVSYAIPSLHPGYAIPTVKGGGNHTAAFADSAKELSALKATLRAATGIAIVGWKVMTERGLLQEVQREFTMEQTCLKGK